MLFMDEKRERTASGCFFLESECLCIQFHTWACMDTTHGTMFMLNVSKCINVLTTLDRSSWSKLSFDMYKQTLPSAKGFVGKY